MCGIAGYYFFDQNHADIDLRSMSKTMLHRGPDASGFYENRTVGLAHNRLSIIDLDARANQPLHDNTGQYHIIFNGELYNYKFLKDYLTVKYSQQFTTSSDTEVLLYLLIHENYNALSKLNGMFAFAFYDSQNDTLLIARDHVGIKPLYYMVDRNDVVFASELQALKTIQRNLEINQLAINYYLHLGYIPAPFTVYTGILKLEAGHYLLIDKSGLKKNKFWKLETATIPTDIASISNATTKLEELLCQSVALQLQSDVPIGVFLSGGTDSSVVAALAQHAHGKQIDTYSIGFNESKYNEAPFAESIAAHIGSNHHRLDLSLNDALHLAEKVSDIYTEPFADSSALPTYLVSQMAAKHCKVVLSGDGGDELFLGYGSHQWAMRFQNPLKRYTYQRIHPALNLLSSRYKRIARMMDWKDNYSMHSHIFSHEQYFFSKKEIHKLHHAPNNKLHFDLFTPNQALNMAERQALFDFQYYLPEDLLVKVDRASMQHSIEVRVPLLDIEVVAFAFSLPYHLRYHNGVAKFLLKEVLYKYVPRQLMDRPKWGFSVPLAIWLHHDLQYMIGKYLSPEKLMQTHILNQIFVSDLIKRFNSGKHDYLAQRIWNLIILQQALLK